MVQPRVEIHFCYRCRWGLRAGWLAQELLATFSAELGEVALIPSEVAGQFRVVLNDDIIHDRKEAGGFIDSKPLKQRIRDIIAPERNLGHVDTSREA